jgi:hypothetical protein
MFRVVSQSRSRMVVRLGIPGDRWIANLGHGTCSEP